MRHGFDIDRPRRASPTRKRSTFSKRAKDKIFVAPGLSIIIRLLYEGEVVGIDDKIAEGIGYELELEAACRA